MGFFRIYCGFRHNSICIRCCPVSCPLDYIEIIRKFISNEISKLFKGVGRNLWFLFQDGKIDETETWVIFSKPMLFVSNDVICGPRDHPYKCTHFYVRPTNGFSWCDHYGKMRGRYFNWLLSVCVYSLTLRTWHEFSGNYIDFCVFLITDTKQITRTRLLKHTFIITKIFIFALDKISTKKSIDWAIITFYRN